MKWHPAEHLAWQMIGGEAVVIDLHSGIAIGLNRTASMIWTLLEDHDAGEIAAALAERFSIATDTATDDLREFASLMCARGLLVEAQ